MKTTESRREPASTHLLELTLNEITSRHPKAIPVLTEFGFDTCCGGAKTLLEVTRRHGIDPVDVLLRLEEAVTP
jgi:iron-sulfur cluster repair protein YtfE (RIC family)